MTQLSFFRKKTLLAAPVILLLIWFFILFLGLRGVSQSYYFQDETEHITNGWMVFTFEKQLYTDITSLHQPLPILFGGALIKLLPYDTLFQLIERIRISMWIFQLAIGLATVWKFRCRGLISTALTTSFSFYFFGWHVLAESLVAPVIPWIIFFCVDLSKRQKKTSSIELCITQIALWWCTFNLLALWPFILACELWILAQLDTKQRITFLSVFTILTIALGLTINPLDWFRETISYTIQYFLPAQTAIEKQSPLSIFLTPVTALLHLNHVTARFLAGAATFFIIALGFSYKNLSHKKHQHSLLRLVLAVCIIQSLNTRVSIPTALFYSGFHLLPYLAGLSSVVAISGTYLFQKTLTTKILSVLFVVGLLASNSLWMLKKTDKLTEFYINYGTFEAYGKAIKTLQIPDSTLLTGSDGAGYINQISGFPIAGRHLFHLNWQSYSPTLVETFTKMLTENPPTFIYFQGDESNYFFRTINPKLSTEYTHLIRTDGSATQLFVLTKELENVTPENMKKFEAEMFKKPI